MITDQVDILLATYNGAEYIEAQIRSIQDQTHLNWRLLIRDDGSKDDTLTIIHRLANEDSRIVLIDDKKGNLGVGGNFRALLSISNVPYIAFCDQDDVWMPQKLLKSLSVMKEMESKTTTKMPLLVHADAVVVDSDMNVIQSRFIGKRGEVGGLNGIIFANSVQGAAAVINKELKQCFLEFEVQLAHDYQAALLAELLGARRFISEPLLYYRQHSKNIVGAGVSKKEAQEVSQSKFAALREKYKCPSDTFKMSMKGDNKFLISLVNYYDEKITPEAKRSLREFFYIFDGDNLFKKLWIAIKNRYGFYSRKDILCLFHFIVTQRKS